MPRNMSFHMTTSQVRLRLKHVTRRLGWLFAKPGDIVNACVKCQGLKKGEKIEKICQIQIVSVQREPLSAITEYEVAREGFPGKTVEWFVMMFCDANKCKGSTIVTRIKFKYIEEGFAA